MRLKKIARKKSMIMSQKRVVHTHKKARKYFRAFLWVCEFQ